MNQSKLMPIINDEYWASIDLTDHDTEAIFNHLLEIEEPQTSAEIIQVVIKNRIAYETTALGKLQEGNGAVFIPKEKYSIGQVISFPQLDNQSGKIVSTRPGNNPVLDEFVVIDVDMGSGHVRHFATELENHILNIPPKVELTGENDPLEIQRKHHISLEEKINYILESTIDLVRIAGRWFPKALLVDVNIGYLNLAEALLDMENGGPLPTKKILDQIELPTDVNIRLTEFSLNHAMQEDGRFDEVGPSGEVLWFLRKLEPQEVRETPFYLRQSPSTEHNLTGVESQLNQFDDHIIDEMQPELSGRITDDAVTIALNYPHWRCGTLPIAGYLTKLFPSAYEAPRVLFSFHDTDNNNRFPGWVVRESKYVYGLHEWYQLHNLIPGSLITLQKSEKSGEVLIRVHKRRTGKDYIKTALVGADGALVLATLKQMVTCDYDERLAIAIPDVDGIDAIWRMPAKQRGTLENSIIYMMRELAKLTPQGHVHAQELYGAVNIVRRCPPGPILSILRNSKWATDLGNLYFRLDEKSKGDDDSNA